MMWFFLSLIVLAVVMFGVTIYREGSVLAAVDYYRRTKTHLDWIRAGGIAVLLSLFIALAGQARADEWVAFDYTEIYFGIDYQTDAPNCDDDTLTANAGVHQNLFGRVSDNGDRFDVNASYTHHSCAIGSDDMVYDGFGIMAVWRKQW